MIRFSIDIKKTIETRILIDAPDIKTAIKLAENGNGLILCKEESISSRIRQSKPVTKDMIFLDEISLMSF